MIDMKESFMSRGGKEKGINMRELKFKMERQGLVKIGDVVELREEQLPSMDYYYVIKPAVAMSGNLKSSERLSGLSGTVKDIEENAKGFYIVLEIEE